MARTWTEQMEPPPPVQKTTLLSVQREWEVKHGWYRKSKARTENAISPDVADILVSILRHGRWNMWGQAEDRFAEGEERLRRGIGKVCTAMKLPLCSAVE